MSWISFSSNYFKGLQVPEADREYFSALIGSAIEFVEKFCGRKFLLQEHTEVVRACQDGALILPNPPIESISRVCIYNMGGVLTVSNSTAQVATVGTTDTGVKLLRINSGVSTESTLLYTSYPTLTSLATAITTLGNGWSASVASGFALYPSVDLMAAQYGSAVGGVTLDYWEDWTGYVPMRTDTKKGIIQIADSDTISPWVGPFGRFNTVRITYRGGFVDVPEGIKYATSELVKSAYSGAEGRIKSESLGSYSYSLDDIDSLPMSIRKILAHYKERGL